MTQTFVHDGAYAQARADESRAKAVKLRAQERENWAREAELIAQRWELAAQGAPADAVRAFVQPALDRVWDQIFTPDGVFE